MAHHKLFPTIAVPSDIDHAAHRSEERDALAGADFPDVDARRWLQVVTRAEHVARDAAAGREVDRAQALALAREILTLEDWEEPATIPKRKRDDLLRSE